MTQIKLQNFDLDYFLKHHWQQQPCVIKQALPDFVDPIDEHDLAGLASEPDIDSRIVSRQRAKQENQQGEQWQVSHGPIEDFASSCQGDWTLLVQAVDQHIPDTLPLVSLFNFLPYWRIDDLMVSYSVANGGVGPHLDQYDVFIIQGKGKRRWQVGDQGNYQDIFPHPQLRQISGFKPQIDEVLEPGDIIYIPPGFPHNGVALEECLNYSIGFRAPNQNELLSNLSDAVQESEQFKQRYSDANIPSRQHPSLVLNSEIQSLKQLMIAMIESPQSDQLLLQSLSQTTAVEPMDAVDHYTEQQIIEAFQQGHSFLRMSEAKALFQEQQSSDNFIFYIQGQQFCVPMIAKESLLQLFAVDEFNDLNTIKNQADLEFAKIFTILINAGYWYLAE
ncbi:cupin domain-containing protein [Alteromonadaceae bacterium BrNp21-10]|nr:cupin domain-containing protein [Alteromonadaceae bacterium BrNp21-10]